ncbi:MAG: TIGR03905 family TSCPD domain-containing protein [Spirochaetaceae bacterium]|nr:TIGR03905 family TSCPD domain-containing protein [Spirochaetaceae bacterium]
MEYTIQGTCARKISFEIQEGRVRSVSFKNGCEGNLQGIARLVEGMPVEEVIARLKGVQCGSRGTSCPDQLAQALLSVR